MITKVTITPVFNVHEWVRKKLEKDWFQVQASVHKLGFSLHSYMVNYILKNRKRKPGTGNLSSAITYEAISMPASVGFRIGDISVLQKKAPYWYVVNYGVTTSGKRFIPGGGKYRPVMFGNSFPNSSLRGHGNQIATQFGKIAGRTSMPSPIRPINYIQSTLFKLGREWARILPK